MSDKKEIIQKIHEAATLFYSFLHAVQMICSNDAVVLTEDQEIRVRDTFAKLTQLLSDRDMSWEEVDEGPLVGRNIWVFFNGVPVPRNIDQNIFLRYQSYILNQ
ncbi:hypothetical protein HDC36_000018 [Xanthomonas sp. JAI131]|uniref:hypothetical protein n=1 Tax=Xanthomonas sp. JAI131 TaxID=2723067 RepID=UPI0015CED189|nr:hypothetical protein [Xanthomonas sp. JAI131]NYF18581.1 hypothetical protein [Xanthomonas sp. JAI131]